jgi:hypothetical protein
VTATPRTISEFLAFLDRAIELWDRQDRRVLNAPGERGNVNVPTIYALTAQTIEMGRAVSA